MSIVAYAAHIAKVNHVNIVDQVMSSSLPEIGEYLLERAHLPLVGMTLRCLGFTAVMLETLLDEVSGSESSDERWGVYEEM